MNAPVLLATPHPIRRACLSASDGAPVGGWENDGGATPDAGGIDLWLFDLDSDGAPALDPVRRGAARAAAARRRLREVLGRALGRGEDEVELLAGARGKPMLRAPRTPPLHFNASRSGPLALIATARSEIGIDIERSLHRGRGDDDPDPEIAEHLRRWTRREAVAKATGIGLGLRLRSPLVTPEGSVQFGGTFWGWRDIALPADTQAFATIAYRKKGQRRCG